MPKAANHLIHSTSPYLLQHAYNPVNWYPWGEEALQKAKAENKLILLSIGYSACHWCHVMEKNCFENQEVADAMNRNYISIKVDREERPDVDQIYMDSLQLMGQRGGWPLNVILTPDQHPFFGGTYFPRNQWIYMLNDFAVTFNKDPREILAAGKEIRDGLAVTDLDRYTTSAGRPRSLPNQIKNTLERMVQDLVTRFDPEWGGFGRAPKFPMPCVFDFLLLYNHLFDHSEALKMVTTSLEKMAFGGIHDQLGGGFARYSVDSEWKVPHFEKMLYDNAQLLSLYTHAYSVNFDILFRDVAFGLVGFIRNEMTSPEGGFYSALDADSEGEEGLFYTWTKAEIQEVLGEEAIEFCNFYQVTGEGNFEGGRNVLWRTTTEEDFAALYGNRSHTEMHNYVVACKRKLLEARSHRIRPALDDKILTSWNGLMMKGLIDAYRVFDQPEFLKMAYDNAVFIKENMMEEDGHLWHTCKDGRAHIDGFLDDYAILIDAFVALYEATFHEQWLHDARKLADYAIAHFYDKAEDLFFYTSDTGDKLIVRKKETTDNVIPSSNSIMALALHRLGKLFFDEQYEAIVEQMLESAQCLVVAETRTMAHWLQVYMMRRFPSVELAIVGKNAMKFRKELDKIFFPNKVICGTTGSSTLPLLENRQPTGSGTQLFVCQNNTCRMPVDNVSDALRFLKLIKEEMVL